MPSTVEIVAPPRSSGIPFDALSLNPSSTLEVEEPLGIGAYSTLCLQQSRWQYVVHGQMGSYREAVCREIERSGDWKKAKRFALCGTGDVMLVGAKVARVQPRRCGHPLCPRCSRYRGFGFVRRVQSYLRMRPHGWMGHIVCTQQVHVDETFRQCRKRLDTVFAAYMKWVQTQGIRAALAVTHCVWATGGGWHLHKHVVFEFDPEHGDCDQRADVVLRSWSEFKAEHGVDTKFAPIGFRKLCGPGLAMDDLPVEQGDFWREGRTAATIALQYVVRDTCQGTDGWKIDHAGERLMEMIEGAKAYKLRRFYGDWRKPVPAEVVAAEKAATPAMEPADDRGCVDQVLRLAERGIGEALSAVILLLDAMGNKSAVQQRLVQVTRFLRNEAYGSQTN